MRFNFFNILGIFIFTFASLHSFAGKKALRVITSTTDIAWAAKKIGSNWVDVTPLLSGTEDPHYVDALPSFISKVSNADVVCIVGLGLEVGWMPKVLEKASNALVQPGGKGYCEVGKNVKVLEKPTGVINRSMGDIHPEGNPHFWLNPKVFLEASSQILTTLSELDPSHKTDYENNFKQLTKELEELYSESKKKLNKSGLKVIEYHKEFVYLLSGYEIPSLGSIEEKPGVLPSAARIALISELAKKEKINFALASTYAHKQTLNKFNELSKIPVITFSSSVPVKDLDYIKHHRNMIDTILNGTKASHS